MLTPPLLSGPAESSYDTQMEDSHAPAKEDLPLSIGEISTEIRTQQPTAEVIVPLRQANQENNKAAKKEEGKLREEDPPPSTEITSAAPPSTSTQPLKGFF